MWKNPIESLTNFLRVKVLNPCLIWLYFRFKRFAIKRSFTCASVLHNLLKYQLRLSNPDSRSEGYDENFDNIVHISAFRLGLPEIFDFETYAYLFEHYSDTAKNDFIDIKNDYFKHKEEVDNLCSLAKNDPDVKSTIEKYFLVRSYYSAHLDNEEISQYYLDQAKTYNPDTELIDDSRLFKCELISLI